MLMLMLDTVDFPIAFWGAIRAGVVPVPVNTLLTAEQVAYMLEDSRAEALCLSAPLLPALAPAIARAGAGLRLVLVAGVDGAPVAGLPPGLRDFAGFVADQLPSPDDAGAERMLEILSCEIAGETASVRLRESYLGMIFVDTFGMLRVDGNWLIYNKLFHVEG